MSTLDTNWLGSGSTSSIFGHLSGARRERSIIHGLDIGAWTSINTT